MTLDSYAGPRCNIGPDEIARRRRFAIASTLATVVIAAVLILIAAPSWVRLLIWPIAAGAAVGWEQVVRRFCVAFGALGLENDGRLGGESEVDPSVRAADRRRALQLLVEGTVIGLAIAVALAALPLR